MVQSFSCSTDGCFDRLIQ